MGILIQVIIDNVVQIIAAFIGTIAFSLLFRVPAKQCGVCGIVGAIGWIIYLCFRIKSETLGFFVASLVIVCLARILAVWRKVPSNIFMLSGMFPIVPGIGIYNTIYHMMTGDWTKGVTVGLETLEKIGAMVLGIIIVFAIPNSIFSRLGKIKIANKKQENKVEKQQ